MGDVSGKSLKAAMMVPAIIGALKLIPGNEPGLVLRALNRVPSGQMAGGFVTCCIAQILSDGTLRIASAGHPSPWVDGREFECIAGLPLGLVPDVEYAETVSRLEPGIQLVLVSDGVIEAENELGELFGIEHTREISGQPAVEIAEAAKAWGHHCRDSAEERMLVGEGIPHGCQVEYEAVQRTFALQCVDIGSWLPAQGIPAFCSESASAGRYWISTR